jgi:DNA-binding winged helix-turn-helix (wHTH) protein
MPMAPEIIAYRINDITIDLINRQVQRGGDVLPLTSKYFEVLCFLLSRHGRLVTRDEIFERIWGEVIVSDTALSQCIKDIRKVLDDDARNPRYIKTVPRHGFIFIEKPTPATKSASTLPNGSLASGPDRRPYKFLDYYNENDKELFFGREAEIQTLCSKILAHKSLILYGRSGVGKSSIVHAGLVPALRRSGHHPFSIRVFHDPAEEIMRLLSRVDPAEKSAETIDLFNEKMLSPANSVIFLFDQFEEFFTLTLPATRDSFIQTIEKVLRKNGMLLRLVFIIREDLLAEMSMMKAVLPDIFHNEFRLQRLSRDQAERAIVEPARKVRCKLEPQLVNKILDDLSDGGRIDPPQLQIVCDTLYDAKNSTSFIGLDSYEKLGAAPEILGQYLERVIRRFNASDLNAVKAILTALISEDEQRLVLPLSALARRAGSEKARELIAELAAARVMRYRMQDGESWLELTHDFLIPAICKWQTADSLALKRAHAMIGRALENYKTHQLLMDSDAIDLFNHLGDKLPLSTEEADLLVMSMLNRRRALPEWLIRASSAPFRFVHQAARNGDPERRICAVESCRYLEGDEVKDLLMDLALGDKNLTVRKAASIVLTHIYGEGAAQLIMDKARTPEPGLISKAIVMAMIRDHNKDLVKLWKLPLRITLLVLMSLVWVRLERNKADILRQTLGGTFGAAFSGLAVGAILSLSFVFLREPRIHEAIAIIFLLSGLGLMAGSLAGFGVGLGMSSMQHISYRHSPWWAVLGATLGGAAIGGLVNIIGVDTLQTLFGQHLIGITGAYEVAMLGFSLALGYVLANRKTTTRLLPKTAAAAFGTMTASIVLTLIKGNLFSASIESIARFFINSQINVQPLAALLGQTNFGLVSRLVLAGVEGLLFGACLTLGIETFGKKGFFDKQQKEK